MSMQHATQCSDADLGQDIRARHKVEVLEALEPLHPVHVVVESVLARDLRGPREVVDLALVSVIKQNHAMQKAHLLEIAEAPQQKRLHT